MADDLKASLTALIDRAAAAHGEYETTVLNNVYDDDWPIWYATWLVNNGYNDLVGGQFSAEDVAARLDRVHERYKADGNGGHWSAFAARTLLNDLA